MNKLNYGYRMSNCTANRLSIFAFRMSIKPLLGGVDGNFHFQIPSMNKLNQTVHFLKHRIYKNKKYHDIHFECWTMHLEYRAMDTECQTRYVFEKKERICKPIVLPPPTTNVAL